MKRASCSSPVDDPPRAPARGAQTHVRPNDWKRLPYPRRRKAVIDSFEKPLHPIVGGVAPGGGMGVGIGYDHAEDQDWFHNAEAMVTIRRILVAGWRRPGRQIAADSHIGRVRHKSGTWDVWTSSASVPTALRKTDRRLPLRETTFGRRGWFRPAPAVAPRRQRSNLYLPISVRGAIPLVPFDRNRFRLHRPHRV